MSDKPLLVLYLDDRSTEFDPPKKPTIILRFLWDCRVRILIHENDPLTCRPHLGHFWVDFWVDFHDFSPEPRNGSETFRIVSGMFRSPPEKYPEIRVESFFCKN